MNEKIKILLLFLLFGLVGCTKETDPSLEPDDDYLTSGTNSSFVIKYAKANSSTAEEKSIKDIWVFAIHNRTKTVRKISKGELLGEGSFKVSLFISQDDTEQEKYMLVVVANANDVIAANSEKYLGMSYAEFTENLVNANDVTATSFDDIAGKGIAMWGDSDYVSIYLSGIHPKLPAIILSRAIARMTIGVGTSTTGVDGKVTWDGKAMVDGVSTDIPFQLTSINLVRSESRYSFAPGFDKDGNMKYNDAQNKATDASVPALSTTYEMTNSLSYPLDPAVIKGRSDIYMPESKIVGAANRYTHFAIVLGGKFETDVVDSYYRVDIKQGENFLNVLRNHNYQLNIRSVSTRGGATIEDAYKDSGRPIDVDVTIVPWNPVSIDLPTGDGGVVKITNLVDYKGVAPVFYDIDLNFANIVIEGNTKVRPITFKSTFTTNSKGSTITMVNAAGEDVTEIAAEPVFFKISAPKGELILKEPTKFTYEVKIDSITYISEEYTIEHTDGGLVEIVNKVTDYSTIMPVFYDFSLDLSEIKIKNNSVPLPITLKTTFSTNPKNLAVKMVDAAGTEVAEIGADPVILRVAGYKGVLTDPTKFSCEVTIGGVVYTINEYTIEHTDGGLVDITDKIPTFAKSVPVFFDFDLDIADIVMKDNTEELPISCEILNDAGNPNTLSIKIVNAKGEEVTTIGSEPVTIKLIGAEGTLADILKFTYTINIGGVIYSKQEHTISYTDLIENTQHYDLDKNTLANRANCYILPKKSRTSHKFSIERIDDYWKSTHAIYGGNTLANTIGQNLNLTAEVLWADFDYKGKYFKVFADVADKSLSMVVDNMPALGGNIIVAIKGDAGQILWSWHMWFTDVPWDVSSAVKTKLPTNHHIMDRNLGALSYKIGSTESFGMFYQWGRKDLFPPSSSLNTAVESTIYTQTGSAKYGTGGVYGTFSDGGSLKLSIANPMTYYTSSNDWVVNGPDAGVNASKRWSTTGSEGRGGKTIFDPCPRGWRTPWMINWNSFTISNFLKTTPYYGRFYKNKNGFFPLSGCRVPLGAIVNVLKSVYAHSATSALNDAKGYTLYAPVSMELVVNSGNPRVYALPIRPVWDF